MLVGGMRTGQKDSTALRPRPVIPALSGVTRQTKQAFLLLSKQFFTR